MKHVYTFLSKKTILLVFFSLLVSGITVAQTSPCGPIVENFDNTGGTTAGFSSSTLNSTAPGFVYGSSAGNGYLQRCAVSSGGTVYEIVSPTYRSIASQASVSYGFELSGAVTVTNLAVFLQYVDNQGFINSVQLFNGPIPGGYNGVPPTGVASVCQAVGTNSINGFTPGESYRFIFQLTASSASNASQCITFDNFRTTGTNALAPLPVTFTNITAKKAGNGVNVFWNVAGEKDVVRYEVERSTNGRDFSKVGEIPANSSAGYLFVDNQPVSGVSFYRVRNIDIDGKFTYTSIVRVNLSKTIALKAFPQPAQNTLTVEHGSVNGKGMISLSTGDGRTVFQSDIKPDVNQTVINLSAYRPGLYIVRFDNGSGAVESIKVLRQ